MVQQDSITHAQTVAVADSLPRQSKPRTPYEVLRSLPRDATPAQQDSAIQAVFQPTAIRYSERPDTLYLPGHGPGVSLNDVSLPLYYEQTFFAKREMLHANAVSRYGTPGDPVPYTVRGDDVITSLLLASFIIALFSFSNARHFILRELKNFFMIPRVDETFATETTTELRYQLFLLLQTSLLLAVLQYFYTQEYIGDTFVLSSNYQLIIIYGLMNVGYFLLKSLFYTLVNTVFFGSKKNVQWLKTFLFISSLEGVALFPLVMLQAYFDWGVQNTAIYLVSVLVLTKLLTFYKCYVIFFRQIGVYLQIILYFCALEMVPLAAFWGILLLVGENLKINY